MKTRNRKETKKKKKKYKKEILFILNLCQIQWAHLPAHPFVVPARPSACYIQFSGRNLSYLRTCKLYNSLITLKLIYNIPSD